MYGGRPSYVLNPRTVSYHNERKDAWVIHDGGVYDVTLFLENHPGGVTVLEPFLGTDVTELMQGRREDSGGVVSGSVEGAVGLHHRHSAFAYKMLEEFRIGSVHDGGTKESNGGGVPHRGPAEEVSVDWTKPLLPQIGNMREAYDPWVHSFPTTDHTVKMFQNDTLEFLTKCPWYVPLVFWLPIIAGIMVYYFMRVSFDPLLFSTLALAGFISWLFFEYVLHRFVFHMKTTTYWGNIIHFLIHGHHHITPMDTNRVVFPPVPALLFGGPVWLGAVAAMGFEAGYAFLLGFVIGYLHYDMTHYFIHQTVPKSDMLKVRNIPGDDKTRNMGGEKSFLSAFFD